MNEGGRRRRVWFWVIALVLFLIAGLGISRFTKRLNAPPAGDITLGAAPALDPEERQRMYEESVQAQPVELGVLETQLQEELRATADEVEALRQEREKMPAQQRSRIYAGADAPTGATFRQQYLEYRMEELTWYQKNTRDSGKAKELGAAFLTEYLKSAASIPGACDNKALRAMAEKAINAGAADPIVRMFYASVLAHFDEMESSLKTLRDTKGPILQGTYPAITKYLARIWPYILPAKNRPIGQLQLEPPVIEAAIGYLEEEAHRENQRIIYGRIEKLLARADVRGVAALYEAVLRSKSTDPWIRQMVAGEYCLSKAWSARGGGWASEVTPEGRRGFEEYLPRAAAHFRRAWQLHPEYPEAATRMIDIAKAGGDPQWSPQDWFYEATRAKLDHAAAYSALRGALLPRWGGSYEQMLAMAGECLDTKRWDTYAPCQVVQVFFDIQQESVDPDKLVSVPGVRPLAKRFAEQLLAATDADSSIPGNMPGMWGYLAAILVRAEEYALARRILEEHGDDIRQRHLEWAEMKLSTLRGRAYANTGPAKEAIQSLKAVPVRPGLDGPSPQDFAALRSRLEEARRLDEAPQVQPYFDDLAAIIDQLDRFFAGELVELPLDESLTGWRVQAEVHQEPEGWVRVQNIPGTTGTQLTPLVSFPPPFVVEVEFAFPPNSGYGNWAGIMFGPADSRAVYDQGLERRIFVNCSTEYLSAQVGEGHEGRQTYHIGQNASHRLQVKLWPGRIQMYHNGTLYVDDATLPPDAPARFTLGERVPALDANVFKCRNIRIRRLSDDPPPPPEMRPDRPATGEMQSQPEA